MQSSARGWQRAFDEPIVLPRGQKLVTLHDAATYITKLPKKESAWARRDQGADASCRIRRANDDGADRYDARPQPPWIAEEVLVKAFHPHETPD